MKDNPERFVNIRPSPRQLEWQKLEFYAFIHYGINQFTGREWGTGAEDPRIFNPRSLDTDKWCERIVNAGMRAAILTAKHHDGFCLWDTKYTSHNVMNSPYGKDVVAQLAKSCKNAGLKFGVYLSPWDRHESSYGSGKEYDDFFCGQLDELLTNYGDIFCCWFDGACGEGENGQRQQYDWERYYALIRERQPNAVISVCGPDVRWCGNEAGHCRESEWSVVPRTLADNEKIAELSQKEDGSVFRQTRIASDREDLGSRDALRDEHDLIWYPAEVNTSIRPGWFYHAEEDLLVRPLEELKRIYLEAVGGNASLLLNIPPHPDGYIAAGDARRLEEIGRWIRSSFKNDLLSSAEFTHSEDSYIITARTDRHISPSYAVVQEDISKSQRIEAFTLSYLRDGAFHQAYQGTVVGHKRICPLSGSISSDCWKLEITSCRSEAYVKTFALY